MEKELIFQILGIPETREEEVVRNAYREVLKRTNPEDDPEGFKRLRQAYEEAVRLISKPETEEEKAALKNDVDLWIDRVDKLYQDLFCVLTRTGGRKFLGILSARDWIQAWKQERK